LASDRITASYAYIVDTFKNWYFKRYKDHKKVTQIRVANSILYIKMWFKKHPGCKKVQGQSEAAV